MAIREAKEEDLESIAEVLSSAFQDEELFGGLKHPKRYEYPDDFIKYFYFKIGQHIYLSSRRVLVATDDATGKVVGVADWERQGKDVQDTITNEAAHRAIQSEAAEFQNRAADSTKLNILEDCFPLIAHFWKGDRAENWSLDLLAVHPEYAGKGHARPLVQFGIDEARKEGIATSVSSAYGVEPFYERLGFKIVGRANVGALKENNMKGGTILFIDKQS